MQASILQHADFEGPGIIAEWLERRGADVRTVFALTEEYPAPDEVDLLVLLGGPMSATDVLGNPWLVAEQQLARDVLAAGGRVFGVCLGAQVLSQALGGAVRRNEQPEVGWFPLAALPAAAGTPLEVLPDGMVVGHWHGDTFDPPPGAVVTHATPATRNQAFVAAEGRAIGLQFHLEWDEPAYEDLIERCATELIAGPWVELPDALREGQARNEEACRRALFELLDRFYPG